MASKWPQNDLKMTSKLHKNDLKRPKNDLKLPLFELGTVHVRLLGTLE